ncbi:MAG: amidohydrolase, partial [Flavobacteriales bacterium]|nr:amidohydrolase [Flavobacteriales bacterium]
MKKLILVLLFPLVSLTQENFPINGVHETDQITHAFINADIHITYNNKIENGTLLIKNDKIIKVGQQIRIPEDAKIIDLNGYTICPSFIDIFTNYGQISKTNESELGSWNPALNIEKNAIDNFKINVKQAESFINNGFGTLNTFNQDGIIRGSSSLILLSYNKPHKSILLDQAALCFSFDRGSSTTDYPKSLMGSIALLRQAYYDLNWYQNQNKIFNNSLKAFSEKIHLPKIFEVNDYQSIFRAHKIGDEFGENYIIKTSGDEYKRVHEIKQLSLELIVPINFPSLKISNDPYENNDISLASLKHADTAPFNVSILLNNDIDIAITTDGIKEFENFLKNIQTIISTGVTKNQILKTLTYNPANFLNIYNQVGSIEKGKKANFLIFSGDLFEHDFCIHQNWINGKKFDVSNMNTNNLVGEYTFYVNDQELNKVELYIENQKIKIRNDSLVKDQIKKIEITDQKINFHKKGHFFSGIFSDSLMQGEFYDSLGNWGIWKMLKLKSSNLQSEKQVTNNKKHSKIIYPNMAYGLSKTPPQKSILFQNATVWTNESSGIIDSCDVAIEKGKIIAVGKNLSTRIFQSPKKVEIIDASNKHITSGIIDEHSHIAISRGVNEGTQSVTAEVRIGDAINANDINIYRQLAGGVTIAQLLHGSANPIGGQSAIIKLRWGKIAEDLKYENAKPFIKFALGENVKQSNWGSRYRTRFPQTRMGVEQIIEDAFIRAKEYNKNQKEYNKNKRIPKPRKDLELDALVEILNNTRFITCHSYIQSEILMLMELANKFDFKINTFTHILEGYKIADELKDHGASASTFSDWWAYKYEVND